MLGVFPGNMLLHKFSFSCLKFTYKGILTGKATLGTYWVFTLSVELYLVLHDTTRGVLGRQLLKEAVRIAWKDRNFCVSTDSSFSLCEPDKAADRQPE